MVFMINILNIKEKDNYVQFTRDLYEHITLVDDDFKELMGLSKSISRDYITKEKDNYER